MPSLSSKEYVRPSSDTVGSWVTSRGSTSSVFVLSVTSVSQMFSEAPQVLDVVCVSNEVFEFVVPTLRTTESDVDVLAFEPPQAARPAAEAATAAPSAPLRNERLVTLSGRMWLSTVCLGLVMRVPLSWRLCGLAGQHPRTCKINGYTLLGIR